MRFQKTIILFLFVWFNLPAKQPAFFIFGEDQFKGLQIYDIIQDNQLNYWIATNEGLYCFDHHSYQKVECEKSKSNSVFGFVANKQGVIYCHNLNNQVFEIKNKNCKLFYELKREEAHPDISLAITSSNQLVIGGKGIIILSEKGEILSRINTHFRSIGAPFTNAKGDVIYHLSGCDSILKISGTNFIPLPLRNLNYNKSENLLLTFFSLNKISYALNIKTKQLFLFNEENLSLTSLNTNPAFEITSAARFYHTKKHLWIAGSLPGVLVLDEKPESQRFNSYYNDYYISNVFEDQEGNILLCTFDKGILVIPDMRVPDFIHSFKDNPAISMLYDSEVGLLLGSSKGSLLKYTNDNVQTLFNQNKSPIPHIFSELKFPYVIFENNHIYAYHKKNNSVTLIHYASLKDVAIVSETIFYLGTNRGIVKCNISGNGNFNCQNIRGFSNRIYTLAFNTQNKALYAATSDGLFLIKENEDSEEITYQNEELYPNLLRYYKGKIYAADKKGGLLIIENNKVTGTLPLLINGNKEVFSKFIINNDQIIAKCNKGLFEFDLNGKLINVLSSSQGVSFNRVIDFVADRNLLYVCLTNGVQQINLDSLLYKNSPPEIKLNDIQVNDISIITSSVTNFNSQQRKIQFTLRTPTLRNRENIYYHYKLEGNDDKWHVNNYNGNQILYNSLAPGSYTFMVKAEKNGQFSNVISYSFTIESPFYLRPWFIGITTLIVFLLMFMVYRWQLNIQNKKAQQINELNASKLTAIQSQMNPHFIFNSLNSIQDLILKQDIENSYSYISTFSDLVRRTLSYSDKDFIDFEQEIKLLELYLSLEKLRFKKDFNYTINFNTISDIQIPPMLIQPFIENALVHGLLHKEGQKNLTINFTLNEKLLCMIEDNGIGRDKAKQIKQRQGQSHESFSGKAIKKRFEILSKTFNKEFGFYYQDIHEDGGTRVTINIPFKQRF